VVARAGLAQTMSQSAEGEEALFNSGQIQDNEAGANTGNGRIVITW